MNFRSGIVALLLVLVAVPVGYCLIYDARLAEAASAFQDACLRDRQVTEGRGRISFIESEGRERNSNFKATESGRRYPRPPKIDYGIAIRNYRIVPLGTEAVAGRPCVKLQLVGRWAERPERKYWIDAVERVVLRRESPRSKMAFEEVTAFGDRKPSQKTPAHRREFATPSSGVVFQVAEGSLSSNGFMDPPTLANGFVRRSSCVETAEGPLLPQKISIAASEYTDGIEVLYAAQIRTDDLRLVQEIFRVFKDLEVWRHMRGTHGRDPEKIDVGAVTLLGDGSIPRSEIRMLISKFR